MNPWIKICGLTSEDAVETAVDCGVDAVGFVFDAGSPRHLSAARAAELAVRVPASILRVAVMRRPTQADVDAILADFAVDALQADATALAALALPPMLATLPVLRSGEPLPASLPRRCVYESARSGSGERADWNEAATLSSRTQLVLAGGLDAGSVGEALTRVRPFGVDVSSGVESTRGRKDVARIRAFVTAARSVFSQ
jgi:phosphoribosylanthranilate isomerase